MNFKFFTNKEYKEYRRRIFLGGKPVYLKISTDDERAMDSLLDAIEVGFFHTEVTADIKRYIIDKLNDYYNYAEEIIYPENIIPL